MKKMKLTQEIKRKLIQIAAFGFTNPYIGNFYGGKIYKGKWKQFCAPGLNCYSCPAATYACPIGALQAVGGSMQFNISFYVVGILLTLGVLFGRLICGFLCPFGFFQELLHKIPTVKFHLPKIFTYIKYAVLVVFVLILPAFVTDYMGMGKPAFCEFICPAGTLEGGIPLLSTHPELRGTIGSIFGLKMTVLVLILIGTVFIYRFFCKTLCPLGAIYGLMNKVSFYQLSIDKHMCINCGKCSKICKMDVDPCKNPDSSECIRCGRCAAECPAGAIRLGFGIKSSDDRKREIQVK